MGRSRYRFTDVTQPHLMTCTVLHWIPVFTRPETVEILLNSLRYLSHSRRCGLNCGPCYVFFCHLIQVRAIPQIS